MEETPSHPLSRYLTSRVPSPAERPLVGRVPSRGAPDFARALTRRPNLVHKELLPLRASGRLLRAHTPYFTGRLPLHNHTHVPKEFSFNRGERGPISIMASAPGAVVLFKTASLTRLDANAFLHPAEPTSRLRCKAGCSQERSGQANSDSGRR